MRITNIRDITVPLEGNISNAIVSFNDHTVSLVAVVSDQTRNGKAVVGFGFNSIGRYAQSGILRDRIIPRILNCPPELLLATNGTEFDAAAVASIAMKNEKPGGHGDRAGAVGALELARLPKLCPRIKHINVCYHHFREHVRDGLIKIFPVGTADQIADVLTKALAQNNFTRHCMHLCGI